MKTGDILRRLPFSLQWMVFFDLSAIRRVSSDQQIKAMYFLPSTLNLGGYSHVILSSAGRMLAPVAGDLLTLINETGLQEEAVPTRSLASEYHALIQLFPNEEVDCIGFGIKYGLPPVLLRLKIEGQWGKATALFYREPQTKHYELLRAVGVEYCGGHAVGNSYLGYFQNYLPTHLHAGALSGFSRTGLCNEFFFRHGEIDAELEAGLAQASEDRVNVMRKKSFALVQEIASRACREPLSMICHPPLAAEPFPYGDLVPLGFVLRTLKTDTGGEASELRQKLKAARVGGLWPFHRGRLETCTDSALILQGFIDQNSVALLERFWDGNDGFYPQLWSSKKEAGKMLECAATRHWCQADFATTCLVRSLREEAGLPTLTALSYLKERFTTRSGLYFANPYLTDWFLAEAMRNETDAEDLKAALRQELVDSRNPDYSFGLYDSALSTALAILALAALGENGRALRLSQIRLLELVEPNGLWPRSMPFYSTFVAESANLRGNQIIEIAGEKHELSIYEDAHRVIGTSLSALALAQLCSPLKNDIARRNEAHAHPRYKCQNVTDYVQGFALAPYLGQVPVPETLTYDGAIH
jgi:hypothetical protein